MFDWLITRKLDRIGKRADPDPAFVSALEARIKAESVRDMKRIPAWKLAAGTVTTASLLFAGTGVYAYTSDDVLPDTPLYPVRTAIEQAAERIAVVPAWRAEVKINNLQRRLKERKIMDRLKKPATSEQVQQFVSKMESAIDAADGLSDEQRERLDGLAAKIEEQYASALEAKRDQAPDTQQKTAIEALIRTQTDKLDAKIEKLQEHRKAVFRSIIDRRERFLERVKDATATATSTEAAAIEAAGTAEAAAPAPVPTTTSAPIQLPLLRQRIINWIESTPIQDLIK